MFKFIRQIFLAALLALTLVPAISSAAGLVPCATDDVDRPCTLCDFIVGFKNIVDYGMSLITIVAIVGIFLAGVMYILSSGDEEMMKKAKGFLKSSLMGFAIVFSGWLIVTITMWALGTGDNLNGVVPTGNWYKFTCSTQSSAPRGGLEGNTNPTAGGSPNKYACDKIDINKNGSIDPGEGRCNVDKNGTYTSLSDCESTCQGVAQSSRCGANNEGLCVNDLSCPPTTRLINGNCSAGQKCCKSEL